MTETEKFLEVGRLAEEYSEIRGDLTEVNKKLAQASAACQRLLQGFGQLVVSNDKLTIANPRAAGIVTNGPVDFSDLVNEKEMVNLLRERGRLTQELEAAKSKLQSLAPHLF